MRVYDLIYKCGCLESLDKGGGLIDCMTSPCYYRKELEDGTQVTDDMIERWDNEVEERNN